MRRTGVTLVGLMLGSWILVAAPVDAAGKFPVATSHEPVLDGALAHRPGSIGIGSAAHKLDRFFADTLVHPGDGLSCPDCTDAITATPEPAKLMLFGAMLTGIGLLVRRGLRRVGREKQQLR